MPKKIPLTQGKLATVDDADYEALIQFKWYLTTCGNHHYAARHTKRPEKRTMVYMHRAITSAPKGLEVDHINGDGLDNRRENLRVCTHGENLRNQGLQANNRSGYRGVSWSKKEKKWVTYIKVDNKRQFVGQFDEKENAARAYDEAARKYHGEFARTNFSD